MKLSVGVFENCDTCFHKGVCGDKSTFMKEAAAVDQILKDNPVDHAKVTNIKLCCNQHVAFSRVKVD